MPPRSRPRSRGTARGRAIVLELSQEIERGRLDRGLPYAAVGAAADLSRSQVSRVCHGLAPKLTIVQAAELLAVVGLDLSARAYPGGLPARDAAHSALLERLRTRLHAILRWRTEVSLPIVGDQRAWDAQILGPSWTLPVEAETRPRDIQSLERRVGLKLRDSGADRLLLLLSETRGNREIIALARTALAAMFPTSSRDALRSLGMGEQPTGSTIVFL